MILKSDTAWKTAARMAALAEEADNQEERELFAQMRNAWITLANQCEFFPVSDVADEQNSVGITASSCADEKD